MARRVELVYGKSGSGKTTWWMALAKHIHETNGLKTRCYAGDGGMGTLYESGLVDDGIVEVFPFTARDYPAETCRLACQGYWPSKADDPTSTLVKTPHAELATRYGLFVFEGLTFMGQYIMGHKLGGLADMAAKGKKLGQDSPIQFDNGSQKFGGNPPAHFGIAQRLIWDLIQETHALPGWVYWTAHQREVTDKETSETIIGPEVAGTALTSKIGGAFGNTIHLDSATVKKTQKDPATGKDIAIFDRELRAYTREHTDPDGQNSKKYFANARVQGLPLFIAPPDPLKFYALLDAAKRQPAVA